jgi:hypothetical protein
MGVGAVSGAGVYETSEEGAVLERRRLVHQNINAAINARPTTPPTTPPAIGPAFDDPDEGLEVAPGAFVDVPEPPVDWGMAVDSGASRANIAAVILKVSSAVGSRYA